MLPGLTQQGGVVLSSYSAVSGKAIKALYGGGQTLVQQPQPLQQPMVILGANGGIGGIPLLRQPGMVLVNPQSDITSLPQIMNLAAPTPTAIPSSQGYIFLSQPTAFQLPPTAFQLPLGFAITAEQLTQQSAQQTKMESTDRQSNGQSVDGRSVDGRSVDGRSSVGSNSSVEVKEDLVKTRNSSEGSDSVEEHFARALGDQWQQLKRGQQTKDIPA